MNQNSTYPSFYKETLCCFELYKWSSYKLKSYIMIHMTVWHIQEQIKDAVFTGKTKFASSIIEYESIKVETMPLLAMFEIYCLHCPFLQSLKHTRKLSCSCHSDLFSRGAWQIIDLPIVFSNLLWLNGVHNTVKTIIFQTNRSKKLLLAFTSSAIKN